MFFLLCQNVQNLVRKVTNRPILTGPADKPSRHCEISLLKSLVCWWLAWFNNSSWSSWSWWTVYSIPWSFSLNQHCQHSFIWLSLQYFKNVQHLVVFMCFHVFPWFSCFFPICPCLPSDIDPEDPEDPWGLCSAARRQFSKAKASSPVIPLVKV